MAVQINVAANQAALVASIQAGVQAYNQRFANNNQINLNINSRAFSQPLGRITGDVKDFEAALAASNARVIAFGASTAVLGGVIRSFKELATVTIDVEKNLADINRVFGLTTSQLQKFSTDLFNVSKQTASSFDEASKAALEFSRQGLKAEDTLQRTKDALTLTRLAGISTANAVDALTSTVNGFAATGISTTQILNKLVAVEQDYAVGAGDLAEALSRTGQAAQEAGVSLDQLNALVTAAQQSTARGGAVIGNALKTIFTRLQRTETLDQLEAFNIAVRDVQGNILPAVTILQNFAGAYKNLADAQKAQLSEQVAGVYQVNILKAVVNDLNNAQGVYAGALQRGASATNEAEIATAKLNRTLDALLSQTATSAQQLANNIGKVTFEPLARYGTEQLKSLVESMNEILEGEGVGSTFANGLLKGIRNILAGPGAIAAFFTLFKLIQNSFTYLSQALPQIAGITTETQNRKNIEQSILQIMQQQGPLSQALAGTMGNQAAQAQLLLQLARQQTAEYQQQSALAKQLAVQLSGQGVKVAGARGLQVTRAGGYVPPATRMAEVVGAQAGGYSPGKVVSSPVGGVMNTAEDIKYIPGFAQPFINPPANSKAGRAHRQNAINRTGVDPYVATGFIPNFAATKQFIDDKGEAITGKKPNKTRDSYIVRLTNYNPKDLKADEDLDLKRELVDSGYWNDNVRDPKTGKILHYNGERNNIYDTLSGNLKVVKYLNKDEVDKATKIAWDGLISGNTTWMKDPNIINLGMNQSSVEAAFDRTKGKLGLTLEDFRFKKLASENSSVAASNITREKPYKSLKTKEVYKTPKQFEKSLNGDFNNFIGDFYEQLVLKHEYISGRYKISAGNTDPADLVPEILGQTMYKGIEAKNTAARINDLIAKAVRTNVAKMNQNTWDKSNDVDFGTFPIYQTKGVTISHNGFIPNFSPLIDDNARNKHDFPGGVAMLPIPDKALQNIVNRQKKRQMTYLDFDRTLVRTMGDIAYSRVSPDKRQGVLNKMFEKQEARLSDIKNSKLTQFGELLRQKINAGLIDPNLLGIMTASGKVEGMPEFISNVWKIPEANQVFRALPGTKEARLADLGVSASGFIPNFAISMQAARIPWFKKYSSLFKNSAGDKDVFRQKDFPTFGNGLDHRYAKEGNADVIGSLYEKFIRNAMNIARNSNVFKTNKEMGFDEMLTTTGNTAPFDFFENLGSGDFRGIQAKAGSKNNQSSGGGVTQTLTKNIARFAGTNPKDVDRLKEAIIVYNDPKYIDPTGKNISARFTPFELSIAALVKDSFANVDPNIKPKLQQLTDSLLNQYNQIKNTTNPRINADGFIPNFASRREMFRDLIKFNLDSAPNNQNVLGGKTNLFRGVRNNKNSIFGQSRNYSQTENSRDYFRNTDIDKIANDHILEKKLLPFVSASTDKDIAEHFARGRRDDNLLGSGAVGSKTIKNSRIFSEQSIRKFIDKYGEKALKDLMLELSNWGSFGSGKGMAINFQSFSQKKGFEGTDFAKEISFLSNGFIPNFAKYNNDALERMVMELAQKGENGDTLAAKIKQDFTQFVIDLENNRYAVGDSFHKDIIAKNFGKIVSDNDLVSPGYANTYLTGSYDKNSGKVIYYKSNAQKLDPLFERKHSYIKRVENELKERFAKRQQNAPVKPLIETEYAKFHKQYPGPSNVNNLNNGFIPNFANKSIADHKSIRAIYDLFIGGKKINEKNGTLDELLKIADPNNNQFKQLKTKGTRWTVQDIKGLPISEGIYANGFIPNFAYKQSVMSLEENMSGNKAIFDTKPFPHIRNSSQPTFSSAIADHGGLGNALSDSMRGQKAVGLMSKGFIPNFARGDRGITGRNIEFSTTTGGLLPGMGSKLSDEARKKLIIAINDEIKSFKEGKISRDQLRDNTQKLMDAQKLSTKAQEDLTKKINANVKSVERQNEENKKSISSRIFGKKGEAADAFASSKLGGVAGILGGSLIGGQLESFIQGGRERYQMSAAEKFGASAGSGVLTAATTGAEIGAFIPVLGPAAGAAIGGLIGLGKAAYDAQETLDDMQKTAESYAAMNIKTTEAAKNYIQQLSDIGNITNPADKNIASFKLQETFDEINKVSPELGKKFLEAGGDITKMQEAIKEFVKTTNEISSVKKLKSSLEGFRLELKDSKSEFEKAKMLKKSGYDISYYQKSGNVQDIRQTEGSLEASFRQFSGFLEIIRTSGMSAEQATKFMEEFANELSSVYVSESNLKQIGIKFGLAEELAAQLASIGDNVIEEMGIVGKFFIKNSVGFVTKMFDATTNKFKTAGQLTDKAEFNVRPLLKNIQDNISNFVLKVASQIQNIEFEKNRLKLLEDAASSYLDSIISPIEKAARESAFKSKEFEMKISADRSKLTSDILSGLSNAPKVLGSSDVEATQNVKNILADIQKATPQQQLDIIDRLISQTQDLATAEAAKFKVADPAALEALNKTFQDQRKNIILLNQSEKENLQLLNLETDINKRRSESAQKLLILQNQLIESDSKRAISIASQKAILDIQENNLQNQKRLPGFGFGISEGRINRESIVQNRQLMIERQSLARTETLGNVKSQLKNTLLPILTPIITAYQRIEKVSISEQPDLYKNLGLDKVNISDMTDLFNLNDMLDKINDPASLESFRKNLEDIFSNVDPTSVLFKPLQDQIGVISQTLIGLNKESQIFESNAQTDIKIADVNDKINNAYIFRLNTLLQIEKAERKILNTIEIQEQILDAERSRPANFFGLGVTGKAEKQIQYDERSLALRQRRQNAQAVQNVQQQLNQFETFRNKIQAEGLGIQSFGFPASSEEIAKAREAIMSFDTSKITNIDQAKNFVSELSKVRTQYGLQGEAAKTLADTEKEINSILNSNADELDKMRTIQDILNGKVRQEAKDRQSIRMGFKEGFDQIQDDADTGLNRLAKETPILFRDGMVEAIKATVKETDNLNEALMGIAAKFLDTFSTQLMTTGVSKIISGSGLGNLFGMQKGGLIRAQNGMYISGSGSGDKYPAMLENGEYVLNRQAVMAMGGPSALDTLNFSMAPRFATGGSFKNELNTIQAMEANMTEMGLENSPYYKELNDAAKQQAEEDRRKKLAEKQQRAAMIGSLVAAAATVAIGAGLSNMAQNAQARQAESLSGKLSGPGANPLMMSGKEFSQLQKFQASGLISSGGSYIGGNTFTGFKSFLSKPTYGQTWYQKFSNSMSKPFRRQEGGIIGTRLSDTVPAYMEGGLYNAPLIKKYSVGGLQSGGSSLMGGGNSSSTVNNNTSATNSFNFNTTVQRDGTINMGSNTTSYEQQDVELSKNLNNKIYAAVGEVIRKEKQFGGSLAGIRN